MAGDINADVESAVFRRLTVGGVLRDAWEVATDRLTPQWGTFSNYRRRRPGGKRIDLILVGPGVDVVSAAINAVRFDGRRGIRPRTRAGGASLRRRSARAGTV